MVFWEPNDNQELADTVGEESEISGWPVEEVNTSVDLFSSEVNQVTIPKRLNVKLLRTKDNFNANKLDKLTAGKIDCKHPKINKI